MQLLSFAQFPLLRSYGLRLLPTLVTIRYLWTFLLMNAFENAIRQVELRLLKGIMRFEYNEVPYSLLRMGMSPGGAGLTRPFHR